MLIGNGTDYATSANSTGICPFCDHQNERGNVCAHFQRTGLHQGTRRYFHFRRRWTREELAAISENERILDI